MKKIFGSLCLFGGFCFTNGAYAQSLGYFETTPYYNNTTIVVNSPADQVKEPAPLPKVVEKPAIKSPYLIAPSVEITTHSDAKTKTLPKKAAQEKTITLKPKAETSKVAHKMLAKENANAKQVYESGVPSRVILFCGTPAEPINKTAYSSIMPQSNPIVVEDWHVAGDKASERKSDSVSIPENAKSNLAGNEIINGVKHKTTNFKQDWDELNRRPQTREEFATRGPIKAIYQDTKSAIANDVPQALADHLPWVDTNRKQENFESVLDRVADNLQRASAADPEWAYPAQNEIRELAQKLDKLPSPPQYRDETIYKNYDPKNDGITVLDGYHKRPVWGGASASNIEQPQKPIALKNNN